MEERIIPGEGPLTVRLVTPGGLFFEGRCEGLQLTAAEGGEPPEGGLVGIRKGHIHALFALQKGPVLLKNGGTVTGRFLLESGLAEVHSDVVTIVTDRAPQAEL